LLSNASIEMRGKTTVTAPCKGTYHDVEAALLEAVEEIRQRLRNNVQLF